MAFTGQLGAQQATPGNIQLGITTGLTGSPAFISLTDAAAYTSSLADTPAYTTSLADAAVYTITLTDI